MSRSRRSGRPGVSEVVSSLAVLMVTIALLGGIGAVAFGSVRSSGGLLSLSSQGAAREYGLLVALVSVQSNSTGTFAWLYNYGWAEGTLSAAYLNGGLVKWSSSCAGVLEPGRLCAISVPAGSHGEVNVVFGTKSLGFAV